MSIQSSFVDTPKVPTIGTGFDPVQPIQQSTPSKLATKEHNVASKLKYKKDILLGLNDSDSQVTALSNALGVSGTRELAPDGTRYDAVEMRHGNHPYDINGISKAEKKAGKIGKSTYAMAKQRRQVGQILGKPMDAVTEQDMIDVANMQQIQKLADLGRTNKDEPRWMAPLIRGVEQTNLTGHYKDENGNPVDIPLNIPIMSADRGKIGTREGISLANALGEDVSGTTVADPTLNAFAGSSKSREERIKSLTLDVPKTDNDGRIGEDIDMAQSSLLQKGAKTYRLLDSIVKSAGLGKVSKDIDKFFGVNDVEERIVKKANEIADPDTGAAIADVITGVKKASRVQSAKEMTTANKQWAQGDYGKAVFTAAKNIDRVLADSASSLAIMVPYVGVADYAASETQDQMIKYKRNNDGKNMPKDDIAQNFAINLALVIPEAIMMKMGMKSLIPGSTNRLAKTGISGLGETAQEYSEGVHDTYASQKEGSKSLGEIATDPKQVFQGVVGGLAGTALSGSANVTGKAVETVASPETKQALSNKLQQVSDKVKSKKPTEAQSKMSEKLDVIQKVAETANMDMMTAALEKLDSLDIQDKPGQERAAAIRQLVSKKMAEQELDKVEDLNLGSEEEAQAFIEEMYESSEDKENTTLLDNMVKIGKKFNISEDTVKTIKDSATVEDEITKGARGYKTYNSTLIRLKKNPEQNSEAIKNVENQVLHFQATQEDRLDRMNKAIAEVEANLKSGIQTDNKVTVPYAGGGKWTMHIKDGKIGEATYQRVKDLQRTIKGIQNVVDKRGIEVPSKEYRIPDRVTKESRKGVFRAITKAIKAGEPIMMPVISKRKYKNVVRQHFTYAVKKLKANGYVEVNANNEVTDGYGRWVPKEQSKPNKAKEEKTAKNEEKKEINRLGKKQAKGAKLEPKEKEFVDAHKAEVKQVSEEYNVIGKLNDIDNKLEAAQDKLNILDENNPDDVSEIVTINDDIGKLEEEKAGLLNKDIIEEILATSSSTKVDTPKKGMAGAKFKQPVNITEYVQTKSTTSLLGSVHARFFSNKVIQEAKAKVPKLLKKILAPIDYKNDSSLKNAKLQKEMFNTISSPARGLVFNIDGEVNENVAVAMDEALTEYMAMGSSNLGTKTSEEVARLIDNSAMTPSAKQMEFFKDLGNYRKNMADDLGKAILSNLGLKENENTPRELYSKLVADLGNMTIELGIEEGMLYNTDVNLKTHNEMLGKENPTVNTKTTVPFIKYSKKGKDSLELYKVNFDRYKEALHVEDTFRKGPHKKAVKTNDISIRNNPITEQPEEGTKVLNKLRKEKYVKQDSVVSWLTDKANEDVVKYHMGYKNEEDMAKMSYYGRVSQEAKNQEIERSIEFLRTEELDEMYFDWFYSKNGRYMLDSNTINPQTDKLHRFSIVPANHKVTINKSNKADMDVFRTAIAQAFNMSTDKEPTPKVQAYGEKILHTDPSILMEDLTKMDGKAEHIAHYIQGVEAVKAYQNKDKEFTVYLSMESDAVTSGFGLKLLQLPILGKRGQTGSDIGVIKDWMRKTGLFVSETVSSMNDMVSKEGFTDSYETLAKEVSPSEVKESNYPEKETKAGKKWSPWNNVVRYDDELNHKVFVKTLPKPNEDGTVSKELRTLFKSPFMTFNYSSGINTIKNRLGTIMADDLISRFVSGKMTKDEALLLADLKGIYGKDLVKNLINKEPSTILSSTSSKLPDLYKYLTDMSINTYGHLAAKSLEENFQAFNESNEVINKAFEDMFIAYNKEYLIEVEKIETSKNRGITKKENTELIRSLRDKFPLIKGPYSSKDDLSDTIAIYDTDNVSSKRLEETYGTVSTKMANGVSKKVQSKLRDIKASLKGGSVIPIHYIDAAVIGNTIKSDDGILGIHDAIIPNILNTINDVKEYNRNVIEVNKGYSVISEVIDSYKRIIGENGTNEQKETLQNLENIYKEAQTNRDIIFNSNIDVVHMSAVPGSKYAYRPNIQSKYTKAQIEAVKGIILNKNNKPKLAFRKLIKNMNLDMKDC